jgi:flagellar hook-associated protein 2
MAVDYLSAINSKGSGMNITQLVDALVTAEIGPKRGLLVAKQDSTDLSISELAKLRSSFDEFQETLKAPNAGVASDVYSSSTAISVEADDYAKLQVATDLISVSQLARAQVLEFTGFTSASASLAEGNLTLQFGTWSQAGFSEVDSTKAKTIAVPASGSTLSSLAAQLNGLSGVSARIVAKGTNDFSLVVMSDLGSENAIKITADSTNLIAFDNSLSNGQQVLAAQNAIISYNGVNLERSSNTISDLVAGVTLDLNATTATAVTVGVFEDAGFAEAELTTYLEKLNGLINTMKAATKRGINGEGAGPLSGDVTVGAILRQLSTLTTTPMLGFGETPLYLTSFGVQTERDGSFSIDSAKFATAFAANPAGYRAIFANLAQSSDAGMTVMTSASANPPTGAHSFVYTSSTTATLGGASLIPRSVDGRQTFYAITGTYAGVSIDVEDAVVGTSSIYFGQSALDRMSDYISSILSKTGDFTRVETTYDYVSRDQSDALTSLSEKEDLLAQLYRTKFTVMEQQITRLKSTGSYLTNMVESWKQNK